MSPTSCQTAPPRARRDKDYSEPREGVSTIYDEKSPAVAPLAWITLDHFSDSARIQRENSCGELATTSKPCLPSSSRTSWARIPFTVSALRRLTTSAGVAAGD